MAKESLFNILNNTYFFDAIAIMDLFSGTGNISYEFASRGTKTIYAIDSHFGCIKYINETSKKLDLEINTFKSDVYKFLEKTSLKADVIFADPPYDFEETQFIKIVDLVFERDLLTKDGVLIVEHSKFTDLSKHEKHRYDKRYGGNIFSFFENDSEEK
jgi:16S rRNA (guanine(966)-N(2))-methyltransferase RsmD